MEATINKLADELIAFCRQNLKEAAEGEEDFDQSNDAVAELAEERIEVIGDQLMEIINQKLGLV